MGAAEWGLLEDGAALLSCRADSCFGLELEQPRSFVLGSFLLAFLKQLH